jgi:hypothetical protein
MPATVLSHDHVLLDAAKLPYHALLIDATSSADHVASMYDPTKDTHLRAAARAAAPVSTLNFSPLADGIVNVNLQDMDDYVYLRGAMKYALGRESWPGLP